jgi:uncharacterized protein (TIGR02611 family)
MDDDATRWVEQRIGRAERLYASRGRIFRVMWVVAGVVVVLTGIAMIVVPGPVTVVIPAGLAMLAVVFGWARRLLLLSVQKSVAAKDRVEDASTKAKVLGGVALACLAAAAAIAVGVWWVD